MIFLLDLELTTQPVHFFYLLDNARVDLKQSIMVEHFGHLHSLEPHGLLLK